MAALLVLLALPGCSRRAPTEASGSTTPQQAVAEGYRLLRRNDIDALYRHALTPGLYARMRAQWQPPATAASFSPAEHAQFDKLMAVLAAPGADVLLWAEIKPRLPALQARYQPQLPAMIGMLRTMADTAIRRSPTLTPLEQVQAIAALGAVADWAQRAPWFDADHVKRVLGILTATAQKMPFRTLDEALSLPYGESMQVTGALWSAFKQILAVYGLSVDTILDSAQIKLLSDDGNVAVVQSRFDVLGQTIGRDTTLIKQDGRWYDRSTLLHWRQVLTPPPAPAPAASVHGTRAPAVSTSSAAPVHAAGAH